MCEIAPNCNHIYARALPTQIGLWRCETAPAALVAQLQVSARHAARAAAPTAVSATAVAVAPSATAARLPRQTYPCLHRWRVAERAREKCNVVRQMREICQILEQMREISEQGQICEILDPQKSILPTHDSRDSLDSG